MSILLKVKARFNFNVPRRDPLLLTMLTLNSMQQKLCRMLQRRAVIKSNSFSKRNLILLLQIWFRLTFRLITAQSLGIWRHLEASDNDTSDMQLQKLLIM